MKLYFPIKNPEEVNGCTHLKAECYYRVNESSRYPRGYYLYIVPIEKINRNGYGLEQYVPSDGHYYLIKEVKRKSAKAENEANAFFKEHLERYIHAWFPHVEVEIN